MISIGHRFFSATGKGFLFLFILLILSCGKENFTTLVRKDLFTISLGIMSDELDYYYQKDLYLPGKSDLFMSDGLFYVSSSNMGKVMGFNSYGDLLFLLMDEEKNHPSELKLSTNGSGNSNKQYASWPFREVGQIALTGDILLIEDRVTQEKSVFDSDLETLCTKVILRFDRDGNYLDFLGREGLGGSPFPHIANIHVRENGDFLVVCQISLGQQIFWYSPQGELLFHIMIDNDNLPLYDEDFWGSLVTLSYHPREYKIHMLVDYYPNDSEVVPNGSIRRIFTLNLTDQKYDEGINVPDFVSRSDGVEISYIYDLLGTTNEGVHILLAKTGGQENSLIAITQEGKTLFSRTLQIFDSPEIYNSFFLSHQGMLMALTYLQDGAPVSWWRSDNLLKRE